MSGDKKVAFLNLMRTRGLHAQAEAWIPESILKSVLKVVCLGFVCIDMTYLLSHTFR